MFSGQTQSYSGHPWIPSYKYDSVHFTIRRFINFEKSNSILINPRHYLHLLFPCGPLTHEVSVGDRKIPATVIILIFNFCLCILLLAAKRLGIS